MEQVENMQDFNIPSIDHELTGGVENSVVVDEGFSSDESKVESTATGAVQGTDSEALSSLLMLSKANNDAGATKQFVGDVSTYFFSLQPFPPLILFYFPSLNCNCPERYVI